MLTEMDAGVGTPRTPFNREPETGAGEPKPAEGWSMILATLIGVLAALTLGLWVFLS